MLALFVPACAALRQERDTEPYAKKRDIAIAKLAKAPGSRAGTGEGQVGAQQRGRKNWLGENRHVRVGTNLF